MSIVVEDQWPVMIEALKAWAKEHTPWDLECTYRRSGGCFLEMNWRVTPHKGKTLWPGGPEKAMVLVCSGPVTEEQGKALATHYASLPAPRHVIVMGTRVLPQAATTLCPDVAVHVSDLLPVDLTVMEFPPRPDGMVSGMQHLLTSWLVRKHLPAEKHDLGDEPAEVVYRRMARAGAAPTREEMERDRTLADRPPL